MLTPPGPSSITNNSTRRNQEKLRKKITNKIKNKNPPKFPKLPQLFINYKNKKPQKIPPKSLKNFIKYS